MLSTQALDLLDLAITHRHTYTRTNPFSPIILLESPTLREEFVSRLIERDESDVFFSGFQHLFYTKAYSTE